MANKNQARPDFVPPLSPPSRAELVEAAQWRRACDFVAPPRGEVEEPGEGMSYADLLDEYLRDDLAEHERRWHDAVDLYASASWLRGLIDRGRANDAVLEAHQRITEYPDPTGHGVVRTMPSRTELVLIRYQSKKVEDRVTRAWWKLEAVAKRYALRHNVDLDRGRGMALRDGATDARKAYDVIHRHGPPPYAAVRGLGLVALRWLNTWPTPPADPDKRSEWLKERAIESFLERWMLHVGTEPLARVLRLPRTDSRWRHSGRSGDRATALGWVKKHRIALLEKAAARAVRNSPTRSRA